MGTRLDPTANERTAYADSLCQILTYARGPEELPGKEREFPLPFPEVCELAGKDRELRITGKGPGIENYGIMRSRGERPGIEKTPTPAGRSLVRKREGKDERERAERTCRTVDSEETQERRRQTQM